MAPGSARGAAFCGSDWRDPTENQPASKCGSRDFARAGSVPSQVVRFFPCGAPYPFLRSPFAFHSRADSTAKYSRPIMNKMLTRDHSKQRG